MKYIVIGLGNFGSMLCESLAGLGHDVMGVDSNIKKVNDLKDNIESVVCLDSRDVHALASLPLSDCDAVFVAIGQSFEESVYTIALLKKLGVKKIIGRSISSVHATVMHALGVDETLFPERDFAKLYAEKVEFPQAAGTYNFSADYMLMEVPAPPAIFGETVAQIDLKNKFGLQLVAIKRKQIKKNILGIQTGKEVEYPLPDTTIRIGDILLLFGKSHDFNIFLKP